MSDKSERGIAAMRVADCPRPAPNSKVYHCSVCDQEVYITPVTWLQAGPKAVVFCTICIKVDGDDRIETPQGKAREALRELGMTDKDIDESVAEIRRKYSK